MDLNTLKVLMWKHWMVRVRRFIHTSIELISPTLLFFICYLSSSNIEPLSRYDAGSVKMTEPLLLMKANAPHHIFYYPDTNITRSLIKIAGEKIGTFKNKYSGVANLSMVNDLAKKMYSRDALVIFEDMDGETVPQKLNYVIRMKADFRINSYEPDDKLLRPRSYYGDQYEEFLRLQWALDTAYLKMLTGNDVNLTVTLQEFPYYSNDMHESFGAKVMVLHGACNVGLLLPYVFLMSRLLEERSTGIQELIKMVGVSPITLSISHFLNAVPTGLTYAIVGTVLSKIGTYPLIPESNGFLMFVMLILHFSVVMSMAFACSYLIQSTQYVVSVSVFSFLAVLIVSALVIYAEARAPFLILTGIVPYIPMSWFWAEVSTLETYGEGVTMSNMFTSHTRESGPVFVGFVFMIVQIIIFSFIAWYFSMVNPGKYGHAMPWNFLFTKKYWTKSEIGPDNTIAEEESMKPNTDPRYFEPAPGNLEVGIKVIDVSKVFNKHKVLDGVTLDVYKGEITIMLGHNGAGKTTLISIITGMISATSGSVYVNGMDLSKQQQDVRKNLGLCPQHNLFFPDLTVLEHLRFFALLKGATFESSRTSSLELLDKLGLRAKARSKAAQLSGGMKRRLQLACALSGGSSILILDEPTSGLDVETRRELWDLLLSLRGERTVLLSTHFMEEADALGDRVVALHSGVLRCHATTMFLKKAIGTGYRLTLTTIGRPNSEGISKAITSQVPQATLKDQTNNSITYSLPAADSKKFPSLFNYLESKRSELGIDSIGVGVSTLEEVFLKLCSDVDTSSAEDQVDSALPAPTFGNVTGLKLYLRQSKVLLHRQFRFIMSRKISFLIMCVFVPILLLVALVLSNRGPPNDNQDTANITMNLELFDGREDKRTLYNANDDNMRILKDKYAGVHFEKADDVAEDILEIGKKSVMDYNKYLAGIELNETNAKILYTTTVRHAAPVALNLLSNLIATRYIPSADGDTMVTRNKPLQETTTNVQKEPRAKNDILMLIVPICAFTMVSLISYVSLPCKERASGTRHAHIMSGCPSILYWSLTLIFNLFVAMICLILPVLIMLTAFEYTGTFASCKFAVAMMYILVMGYMAFFALMYLVSMYVSERVAGVVLVAIVFTTGLITPFLHDASATMPFLNKILTFFVNAISIVSPAHAFTMGAVTVSYISRLNSFCDMNRHVCPNLVLESDILHFNKEKCCRNEDANCYFCFSDGNYDIGAAKWMVVLTCHFLVLWTLVILTENGFINRVCDKIVNVRYKTKTSDRDEIVRAEAAYVRQAIKMPIKQIPDAMLVSEVHKNYFSLFSKNCNAVKGISFSVKKGECFGLLGVNGAGKSTTFKMMTAEECMTRGDIVANARNLRKERETYLNTLGYCPQFFGLDQFLTGNENLKLVLTLRGLVKSDVQREVKSWIEVVGLEKYADRPVSAYSGGCTRRLGCAAALACGAPITLLDEPTSGVDVSARRRVWKALRRGLAEQRAVVITSHSMDEMEALCSRIAIMSKGSLVALGSAATLRANHAAGHAVIFKIRYSKSTDRDDVDSASRDVTQLKESVNTKFNCTLKDEHKTMLHYHINETMRYSDLFESLESLRNTFPNLIEDYSVTETTLEEVFLSFAKENQERV